MKGAFISGVLDFQGCKSDLSLVAFASRFENAPVLMDAELGHLNLSGSVVPGLNAHRVRIARGCLLNGGFQAYGTVNLSSAEIGQTLACDGGSFDGDGGKAINGNAMTVGASVFLSDKFSARGTVDLGRAAITGQLACSGGSFDGDGGDALNGDAMTVGADVFLRDKFSAKGTVNLRGAAITGQLACNGGSFDGDGGNAINGNAMTVGADVFFQPWKDGKGGTRACSFKGHLDLRRAKITCNLIWTGARVEGAIQAERLSVGGAMRWRSVTGNVSHFDLEDARLGKLDDDRDSWKIVKRYFLNGLTYDALGPAMSHASRLEWLEANKVVADENDKGAELPTFHPQPFTQVARVLLGDGHVNGASRILATRQALLSRNRVARAHRNLVGTAQAIWRRPVADLTRVFELFFGATFGHGYLPMRALGWTVVIIGLSGLLYGTVWKKGEMAPVVAPVMVSADWAAAVGHARACPLAIENGYGAAKDAECIMPLHIWTGEATGNPMPSARDYESFNALLYGADVFIPLVGFGQEVAWAPSRDRGTMGRIGYWARPAIQLLGWIITALGAAVLTGLVGRRD